MRNTKNSTVVTMIICAITFIVFVFCFLYYYEADVLTIAQHELSKGQTHYNRTVGAFLITIVLGLFSWGMFRLTKLRKRTHALVYFPALLTLAIISDVSQKVNEVFCFGAWTIIYPLLLIIYGILVFFTIQFQPYEPETHTFGYSPKILWINLMQMGIMFILVSLICNSNKIFHQRARVEVCLVNDDLNDANKVISNIDKTDSSLTCLKAFVLSKQGKLGESFFETPVTGGAESLLPNASSVKMLLYPKSKLYTYLGKEFKQYLSPLNYCEFCTLHHLDKPALHDYYLVGLLMDKKLDKFVAEIGKYYPLDSSLPKHYREALILYKHHRVNPKVLYHSSVMDADFADYQTLERKYKNTIERKNAIRETFGTTYWYYWQYC